MCECVDHIRFVCVCVNVWIINMVDLDLLQFGCGMCHMFYRFSFLFVCWRDGPDWSDVPGVILFFLSAVFLYLLPF